MIDRPKTNSRFPAFCLIILLPPLALSCLMWYRLAAYPYDWDPGEGDAIYHASRLLHGQPMYGDRNQFPMTGYCYPPVFPVLCAPLVAIWGRQVVIGRLVSWLAECITAGCIFAVTRRLGAARWAAAAGAIVYFCCPSCRLWGALSRVDSVMTALCMLSFTLLTTPAASKWRIIIGSLVGVAAVFTKPYAVIFVSAGLVVLAARQFKLAMLAVVTSGLAGLVTLGILQKWSNGWFWNNAVAAHATIFRLTQLKSEMTDFVRWSAVLTAFAWIAPKAAGPTQRGVLAALLLAGTAIALFIGHLGSASNYLLPMCAAFSVAAGLLLDRVKNSKYAWLTFSALLLQALLWSNPNVVRSPTIADKMLMDSLAGEIQCLSGEKLVDRQFSLQSITDVEPLWEPCLLFFLYPFGKWDPTRLVQDIERGRFEALVLTRQISPPIEKALFARYQIVSVYNVPDWTGGHRYGLFLKRGKVYAPSD